MGTNGERSILSRHFDVDQQRAVDNAIEDVIGILIVLRSGW